MYTSVSLCIYIYIYIYTYTHMHILKWPAIPWHLLRHVTRNGPHVTPGSRTLVCSDIWNTSRTLPNLSNTLSTVYSRTFGPLPTNVSLSLSLSVYLPVYLSIYLSIRTLSQAKNFMLNELNTTSAKLLKARGACAATRPELAFSPSPGHVRFIGDTCIYIHIYIYIYTHIHIHIYIYIYT